MEKSDDKYNERLAVLCIAQHNLGVELEFLKRVYFLIQYDEALVIYKKVVEYSNDNLGESHPLTVNL